MKKFVLWKKNLLADSNRILRKICESSLKILGFLDRFLGQDAVLTRVSYKQFQIKHNGLLL